MATIEKVSCFPNEGTPQVITGTPVAGDLVRIVTSSGAKIYERYTPPEGASPPDPKPRVLDAADFSELCYGALGTMIAPSGTDEEKGYAGLTRYGAILKAVRADDSDVVVAAYDRYESSKSANRFAKDKVAQFFALIAAHLEAGEADAIIEAWPNA